METTYRTLYDLLNDCTVRVQTKGGHGTGFFVAPGLILTCAHVIKEALPKNSSITVHYGQREFRVGKISKQDVFADDYPDLALLRVDFQDHPCVLLGTEYDAFVDLYSYGYTKDHPDGEATTVECEGKQEKGGTFIKVKKGQVKSGASGSPLLNTNTDYVCGMIDLSRSIVSDLGGAGIPMATAFAKFPDLERQNLAFHQSDARWRDLLETDAAIKSLNAVSARRYAEPGLIEQPEHWVERLELSLRVNRLLDQARRVLLTGMGGIGKTALAQTLVDERLRAGSKPILWLDVAGEKADILIEALAETCNGKNIPSLPNLEAKKLALKELLSKSEVGLLVFDNVRNPFALDDLLKAIPDDLPVLMTSRMSFDADDIVDVDQLSSADALTLLAKASGAADYSKDESAKALCKLVGFHPLALEIAGASMKERRGLSPKSFLDRLEANPIKLSSLRRGEIRPLLDDCVADLPDALHSVFFAFGKFPANRSTPTFLAVYLNQSKADVTDALDALVVRNLVKRMSEAEVYYLHDLVFHYVQTVSGPEGQDKNQLIQTGIKYLEEYRRDYDLVGFDLSNLLGIAGIAQGLDLVKLVSYLTIGNFPLQEGKSYADQRGYSLALIGQMDRAIEAARMLGEESSSTLHYLVGKRGNSAFGRGDYEVAANASELAFQTAPNEKRKIQSLALWGRMLAFCGRIEDYRKKFEEAHQLAFASKDDLIRIFVLEQESHVEGKILKEYEKARKAAKEQLQIAERLYERNADSETSERLFYALLILGSAECDLAKQVKPDKSGFFEAISAHDRARNLAEQQADDILLAHALTALGEDLHYVERLNEAQVAFNRALQLWRSLELKEDEEELVELMLKLEYPIPEYIEKE